MRAAAHAALAVMVALAGCSGVFGGETETTTLTPAAVPTDRPTLTPVPQLAPGLTGAGVTNASALAAAHHATLDGRSFTVRRTTVYRTETGTSVRELTSVTRVASDGRFRVTKRWIGETALRRETSYFDGERLLVMTTDDEDETGYRRTSSTAIADEPTMAGTGSEQIERVFTVADTRVVGRIERNGTAVYRLAPEANRSNAGNLDRSVSAYAHVSARGFVRNYTFDQRLSGESSGGVAAVVVSTRYEEIGSMTVERPSWYGEAMTATNATTRVDPGTTRLQ
jgi:hypothetical protein